MSFYPNYPDNEYNFYNYNNPNLFKTLQRYSNTRSQIRKEIGDAYEHEQNSLNELGNYLDDIEGNSSIIGLGVNNIQNIVQKYTTEQSDKYGLKYLKDNVYHFDNNPDKLVLINDDGLELINILKDKVMEISGPVSTHLLVLLACNNLSLLKSELQNISYADIDKYKQIMAFMELPIKNNKNNKNIVGRGHTVKYYKNNNELNDRLNILVASLQSGNSSIDLKNEIAEILDKLLHNGKISREEYNNIYSLIV